MSSWNENRSKWILGSLGTGPERDPSPGIRRWADTRLRCEDSPDPTVNGGVPGFAQVPRQGSPIGRSYIQRPCLRSRLERLGREQREGPDDLDTEKSTLGIEVEHDVSPALTLHDNLLDGFAVSNRRRHV